MTNGKQAVHVRRTPPVTDTPAILSQELATQNLKMRKEQDVKQGCFVCLLPRFTAKTRFAIVFEPFDRIAEKPCESGR